MLVENSIWPSTTAFSALSILLGGVMTFHIKKGGMELVLLSFLALLISLYFWWKEVVIEGTYQGLHTKEVQKSLTVGFILFVVSEAIIFFSFFFSYFYFHFSFFIFSFSMPNAFLSLKFISVR